MKSLMGIFAWVLVLPTLLCWVFKFAQIGSIGPLVLIHGLSSVLVLPILFIKAFQNTEIGTKWRKAVIAASIVAGLAAAIIDINIFMALTWAFNIMDYQMM